MSFFLLQKETHPFHLCSGTNMRASVATTNRRSGADLPDAQMTLIRARAGSWFKIEPLSSYQSHPLGPSNTPPPPAMKCAIFLAVVSSTALVANANPTHSIISALLRRQGGPGLHARESGVDVAGIATACQPSCTDVVTTLNVGPSFDLQASSVRVPRLTADYLWYFFPLSLAASRRARASKITMTILRFA
jgi:hypothetical protein